MRLFLYYAAHTFKNQLKKLIKSWVLIFLIACMAIGFLFGMLAGSIVDSVNAEESEYSISVDYEDEYAVTAEETEAGLQTLELIAGAVFLIVLAWSVLRAEKSGGEIFLPADAALLFTSPMTPQRVLLFRMLTQLGISVLASLYLIFQAPLLIVDMGLTVLTAVMVILGWAVVLVYGVLLQVFFYIAASSHPRLKSSLRIMVYTVILLIAAAFLIYWRMTDAGILEAAKSFFNAELTRYIPVWGWAKGLIIFAQRGSYLNLGIAAALSLLGIGLLILLISRMKADFYEDAMVKSEAAAQRKQAQRESSGLNFGKRKKDRSEKLLRNEFNYGHGASVFFFKALYNRFRFGILKIFTGTSITYLVVAIASAVLLKYVAQYSDFTMIALIVGAMVFFRSLGNPLAQDTNFLYFRTIPENIWAKMFYSLLGGSANCFLDLLPAMIAAGILLLASPLQIAAWIIFILTLDFYSTMVGTFIDVSVPVHAGKMIKQMVQIMFIYFGLGPDAVLIVVGFLTNSVVLCTLLAAVVNLLIGAIFFGLAPLFLGPKGGTVEEHTGAGMYNG